MYKVMIVDDEPLVKIALRQIIDWESHGYYICGTAANGKEALEQISLQRPHIIITDLKMPVMDGIELIQELVQNHFDCRILILSNYSDYENVRKALKLGAHDYLLKINLRPDELISQLASCVKSLLSEHSAAIEQELHPVDWQNLLFNSSITEDNRAYFEHIHSFYLVILKWQNTKANATCSLKSYGDIQNTLVEVSNLIHKDLILSLESDKLLIILKKQSLTDNHLDLKSLVSRIHSYLEQFLLIELFLLYSEEITDYKTAGIAFQILTNKMKYSFYQHSGAYNAQKIQLQNRIPYLDYRTFAERIWKHVISSESECAYQMFETLITYCAEHMVHPDLLKKYIFKVINYLEIFQLKNKIEQLNDIEDRISLTLDASELFHLLCEYSDSLTLLLKKSYTHYRRETDTCIHFINANFRKKLTLTDIATHVSLSEKYLCRIFKEDTGISVIQYINRIKMEQAASLIVRPNTLIKEAAEYVGISDPFYFNRMFKKYYGVSPSEYVKQNSSQ
ncbi:MAG: response regulator [Lachnospiraceae bacterium]